MELLYTGWDKNNWEINFFEKTLETLIGRYSPSLIEEIGLQSY